jgi:hypothetical protein
MRTLVIVGLIAGAVAIFAPDQGAGLMRSVVHGFGWGSGANLRITCLVIIVGETCRSAVLDRRVELGRQTAIELDGIALERAPGMGAGIGPIPVEVAHRSLEHALGGVGAPDERREVRQAEIDDDGLPPRPDHQRSAQDTRKGRTRDYGQR